MSKFFVLSPQSPLHRLHEPMKYLVITVQSSYFYDFCQVVPAWLNCLPIKGDLIEAKVVHDQLCSMVERYYMSSLFILWPFLLPWRRWKDLDRDQPLFQIFMNKPCILQLLFWVCQTVYWPTYLQQFSVMTFGLSLSF